MGGDIFIGIRRRNGEVFLAERWTNPTSWWFNNPAMYDPDEKLLKQYTNLVEKPRPQTEIHPSEYGVILYDARKGRLLSCQCYTGIGSALVSLNDVEMIELAQDIHKRGLVTGLECWSLGRTSKSPWGEKNEHGPVKASLDKLPRFFEIAERSKEILKTGNYIEQLDFLHSLPEGENGMFGVSWTIPGLEIVHHGGLHGYHRWPEVLKWVAENGWDVPIWSQAKVDETYKREDDEDTV